MDAGADHPNTDALRIVEKYETFVNYLYPILQNCPRRYADSANLMRSLALPPGGTA